MCHYQTLYHDDNTGYVVRCAACEKIQLGYGNMVLTFGVEEFDAFRWWLRKIGEEQPEEQSHSLRCIMIPTPCEGMKLLLSRRELAEFLEMLDAADAELEALEMIKLFEAS
ncbi:MAG TPA: hypothetical protein PKC69_04245 [Chitinophagaceae bacterium]|nr:hypothetical protein [Chitinophagaceae bacterium]